MRALRLPSLRLPRSEVALGRDPSGRYLPSIVAAMIFLAAVALAGALALSAAAARWQDALSGTMTVEIPPAASDRTAAALALLRATPGIARAEAMSRERIDALLEPWLGKGERLVHLPVPTLIDVTLTSGARVDTAALEVRLAGVAPGAAVDDHRRWLDGVIGLARVTFGLALAVVAIVGVVAAGAVIFVTRAKLAANREAIDLLHLMGADDHYIAGHFARQGLVQGIQGGIVGLLAAAAALAAMALVLRAVDPALGARATLSLGQAATLLLLPPLAGLIAMLTARRTVLSALARVI